MHRPDYTVRDLGALLDALDPAGTLVQRHLWLMELVGWIRGDAHSVAGALARVRLFMDAVQARPDKARQLRAWWHVFAGSVDIAVLLADFGFSSRSAFVSEFFERVRLKLLPTTPETHDAAALFAQAFSHRFDAQWLASLDEPLVARIASLLGAASEPTDAVPKEASDWQHTVLEALTICCSQVRAAGFASELRLRMSDAAREAAPFHALAADCEHLRLAFLDAVARGAVPSDDASCQQFAQALRTRLEACRAAGASVYAHLDEHGISVGLVFRVRQLRERILRIRLLLDCLIATRVEMSTVRLLAQLAALGRERRSLRALVASNSSMLAAKVTDRSSEQGEHYITRNHGEYRAMLRQAAGGGALTALTTWAKFGLVAIGMASFWNGFWVGALYAGSFILMQLLHFTLATKQPAMTAPAMAARLKDIESPAAREGFVDEVTHLVRSQVAAVFGNVGMVVPVAVLLSLLVQWRTGHPMIDAAQAHHVFESLHLLGTSTLFAAGTGIVLFLSSLIAGWAENSFVFHRLDSALRHNPRVTRVLGVERADRWASFWRHNISGFASNLALGFMLGMIPAIAQFFGLGLDLRHVTLSSGQLGAAAASVGWAVFRLPEFWWCVAAIPVIGALNLGVSFYCAFRLAVLSHNIGAVDRALLRRAVLQRMVREPLSFLWPVTGRQPPPGTALAE